MTTDAVPLGCLRLWCPALDHRLPSITDVYNAALRGVAAKRAPRVGLVDNAPIAGPMWDAAPDWCHARGRVFAAAAANVAATVRADLAFWAAGGAD